MHKVNLRFLLSAFIAFSLCGGLLHNKAEAETAAIRAVPLREFFPVAGNLGDYTVAVPSNYIRYKVPEGLAVNTILWGQPEDIKAASANPDGIDFDRAASGVFRARFTPNAGVNAQGEIIDGKDGTAMTEARLASKGIKDAAVKKGSFYGVKAAPALTVTGSMHNKKLRMAYLYSPVDNSVLLVSLQGGSEPANTAIWNNFVASLKLQ